MFLFVIIFNLQPHGSAWVYRQACQYLREEFSAVIASPVLHQLDKSQLIHVLQSNFLQASELEVLQAVLKWGEQELIRRMEDREPNILSHTAHSVTRKGVKKRDLSDVELREILSELLPLVRMDHVLPPNSEVLAQAIRRGLVSTPPSHMIGDDRENLRVNAWIRGGKNQGLFVRPRLFMPYFEEVKVLLEDRMASSQHQAELMRMRRSRHLPDIPDTLYMVSRINAAAKPSVSTAAAVTGKESVNILAAAAAIPPPDTQTLAALLKREHKLHQSPMCQRALLLPLSSKHEIDRQIRLRVVREFNLPDAVSDLLETSLLSNQNAAAASASVATTIADDIGITSTTQTDPDLIEDDDQTPPPSPAAACSVPRLTTTGGFLSTSMGSSAASSTCGGEGIQPCYSRNLTFPRQHPGGLLGLGSSVGGGMPTNVANGGGGALQANYARLSASVHHRSDLPALITEGDYRFPHGSALGIDVGAEGGGGAVACGEGGNGGHLSDMMPDVAMATASLGQLHLANNTNNGNNGDLHESLQLDLGDGPSHIMGGGAPGAAGPLGLRGLQHPLPPSNYHHFMQRSNSPFDMLRQGQHSPAPHPPPGTYNSGPPRFL
ncbi:BTB/POZ domain-containing protein 7-like [Rhagoletis pomonella]|uniref:BTB/POZ domain-containing protein 7-like n=1 Tax=Rhagoletis pomonella TaxID=28610 RepID=UPI00177CCD08|nr:BTB/POZ domain-containing protein 7-like [Rhagoletis pomonella]